MRLKDAGGTTPLRGRRAARKASLARSVSAAGLLVCVAAGGVHASPITIDIDGANQDYTNFSNLTLTFDLENPSFDSFRYDNFDSPGLGYTSTDFRDSFPTIRLSRVTNGSDDLGNATKSITVSVSNSQFSYTQFVTSPDPREPGAPMTEPVYKIGYSFSYEIITSFVSGLPTFTSVSGVNLDPRQSSAIYTGDLYMSAVPLPASAPLFGAAVLAVGLAGYGLKRKASLAAV